MISRYAATAGFWAALFAIALMASPAMSQDAGGGESWTEEPAPAAPAATARPSGVSVYVAPAPTPLAPPLATPVAQPTKKRSPGLIAAGGVLTGVGFINVVAGFFAYLAGSVDQVMDGPTPSTQTEQERQDRNDRAKAIGGAMMFGGAVLMAVGIPVLVVGVRKRPVEPDSAAASRRRIEARSSGLAFTF